MCEKTGNDAVRYSRTGDAFHYRWVALRCLKMINPVFGIDKIMVENSQEDGPGEYAIDMSEYSEKEKYRIHYYQMKHTVRYKDKEASISFLKKTLEGFAKRYIELRRKNQYENVAFHVVTNRKIKDEVKGSIYEIGWGKTCSEEIMNRLRQYTALNEQWLRDFCQRLDIDDTWGDYKDLWYELFVETNNLLAGLSDKTPVDKLEIMVRDKALPECTGRITKEDVLKCLGYSSMDSLFPAPPMLEKAENVVKRTIYKDIMEKAFGQEKAIVHASGGVGKSIFAQYVKQYVEQHELGETVIYDCFGAGTYRNRSKTRHGFKNALTQIVNELAVMGLCDFMLVSGAAMLNEIMRMFLQRIKQSCDSIKRRGAQQKLYLIIDAADNAEMAAEDYKEQCFVHELLHENMPEGCCLIMLCRTERIHMLKPSGEIPSYELVPFSVEEVETYFEKSKMQGIQKQQIDEIFCLTGGNPRVLANAVAFSTDIKELLDYLGPKGTNVNQQIEYQLRRAVNGVKEELSEDYQKQIDQVCLGLSVLPPFIPVSVLAKLADVEESLIKSFIADMGRAFWMTGGEVIQFRDEPVETWFRETFVPDRKAVKVFADRIKPLANESIYVAEVLPVLYLHAGCTDELIALAYTEEGLPDKEKFDNRRVKLFRYKFAFHAALKAKRYKDTVKIAFLTSGEASDNQRLNDLLKENLDLVPLFSGKEVVQELAFSRELKGRWQGSENVYIASLLSGFPACKGETRTYLRASGRWLFIYLNECKKDYYNEPSDDEISELGYTGYHLLGVEETASFLKTWKLPSVVFHCVGMLISRLIDQGNFSDVDEFALQMSDSIYGMAAICNELSKVGKSVQRDAIIRCWENGTEDLLDEKLGYSFSDKEMMAGVVSFIEQSLIYIEEKSLIYIEEKSKITDLVKRILPDKAGNDFGNNDYYKLRSVFLRGHAIKKYLKIELDEEAWMPEIQNGNENDIYETLFPLYNVRLKLLLGEQDAEIISQFSNIANSEWIETFQYKNQILNDIAIAQTEILLVGQNLENHVIEELFSRLQSTNLSTEDQIAFLRGIVRNEKLYSLWDLTERKIFDAICMIKPEEDRPDRLPKLCFLLTRAVLAGSFSDAREYFNFGIESVNSCKQELISVSKVLTELCKKCAKSYQRESELVNQFIEYMKRVYDSMHGDWSGRKAMQACARLSPADSLAAISRWRERYEEEDEEWKKEWANIFLDDAVIELISEGYLSAAEGWGLSAFLDDKAIKKFSIKCAEYAEDAEQAARIKKAGEKYAQMSVLPEKDRVLGTSYVSEKSSDEDIQEISRDIDVLTQGGLKEYLSKIEKCEKYRIKEALYKDIFRTVPREKRLDFIDHLIEHPQMEIDIFLKIMGYFPETWVQHPSIQRKSSDFIYKICSRWSLELLDRYRRRNLIDAMPFDVKDNKKAYEGFMNGLVLIEDFGSPTKYQEYISVALYYLTSEEVKEVLEFSLNLILGNGSVCAERNNRSFENKHYPDGKEQLAGFLYTALGSPAAKTRWKGVHAVVRLAEMGCTDVLQKLVCYNNEVSGVFLEENCVHDRLQSILYLLEALFRIAKDNVELMIPFKEKLVFYASGFMQHARIQRAAFDTIKLIYEKKQDFLEKEEYEKLMQEIQETP
ncbi:MAG: hypothetical protein Q4C77_01085 [Eubacteriales bacterium]|nr:hypothetical protein [Eubacteriales bacterium]